MKGVTLTAMLAVVFSWMAMAQAQQPQPQTIRLTGQVVGSGGEPLSGVFVGGGFRFDKSTESDAFAQLTGVGKTDTGGRFEIDFEYWFLPTGVVAYDLDRKLGATYVLTKENLHEPIVLALRPLRKVVAEVQPDVAALEGNLFDLSFGTPDGSASFISASAEGPTELYLPPGEYGVFIFCRETQPTREEIVIPEGSGALHLKPLKVEATKLARSYGHEPPKIEYTEIRGLPQGTTLSDLKGKWVLLEFWGFW